MKSASEHDPLGVYVHVPYCVSLCPYCDFNSVAHSAPPWERYVAAISAELWARAPIFSGLTVRSIYFGGGTPSLAPSLVFREILAAVRERFVLANSVEFSWSSRPPAAIA